MKVCSIRSDAEKGGYINPLKAGVLGGIFGYAAKFVMPLSNYEKKMAFNETYLNALKTEKFVSRSVAYQDVIADFGKSSLNFLNESKDIFVKNKNEIIEGTFKGDGLEEGVKANLKLMTDRLDITEKASLKDFKKNIIVITKNARPMFYFIAMGAAIYTSIATLGNTLNNNKKS